MGYTTEKNKYVNSKESIIFDDFTLDTKFVDFPYMVKSSAIKILTLKDVTKDNIRFNFELLSNHKFNMLGHARHYISVVQPEEVFTPNKQEQDKIGELFTNLDNLITLHQRKCDTLTNVKKSLLEKMFPKNSSNIPEIRFKGFTDVWEQRKLEDITQIVMGQSPDSINYTDNSDDTVLIQGNADLNNGIVVPRIWSSQITKKSYPNDIIFTVRAPVGEIARNPYFATIGRGVASFRGNDFLYQSLIQKKENNYWNNISAGSTFDSINSEQLKNVIIDLPKNDTEQDKIGELFTNLDNLITLHQRKHYYFFYSWEQRKLEGIVDFYRGHGLSWNDINEDGVNKCILYGNLYTDYGMVINEVLRTTNCNKMDYFLSEVGDVLIPSSDTTPTGLARASSLNLKGIILGGDINVLRPKTVNGTFLSYLINNNKNELIKRIKGTTVRHLNNSDIKDMDLYISNNLNEQVKIANLLTNLDNLITLHQHKELKRRNDNNEHLRW